MGDFIPIKCDLTPLVEGVTNGVGKLLNLAFGPSIARKEAARKLIEAKAERESRLIVEGKGDVDKNGLFISSEQEKTDNVQQCFEYAVVEAMNKEYAPSEENISRTFFNQWREYAQHIDEEELKSFWGRILTEEVYQPNSISLRALNTLALLSLKEAKLFQESVKYIIFDSYLAIDFIEESQKKHIIETLYDMGAISNIPKEGLRLGTRIWRFKKDTFDYHLFYHQKNSFCVAFHVENSQDEDQLSLELLQLTPVGRILYNLALTIDENLSIDLAKNITKEMLNKIDQKKTKNIHSITVYKLENQKITNELFSKNF